MMTSSSIHSDATPYQDEYDNILRNYKVIDVGLILNVSKDGAFCTVQGFDVHNGVVQTYKNVEMLYPGYITLGIIGCPCVLFRPATPVSNIQKNTLLHTEKLHAEASIKAIPLFFNKGNVKVGLVNGNYTIASDFYTISFTETSVEISLGDCAYISGNTDSISLSINSFSINMDVNGVIESLYKDSNGVIVSRNVYSPEDGSFTYYSGATTDPEGEELDDLDTFTKWTWIKKFFPDGTIEIKKQDAGENILDAFDMTAEGDISVQQFDAAGNVLNALSVNHEGVLNVTTGENVAIDIDQDGNINITNNKGTIKLDSNGNLSFEVDGDVSLKTKGDVSAEINGNASIKATDVNVEASSKVVVKGTNVELNGMTKATGTSFECGGTVAPTGTGALCGLPACLLTGAPHVGNKAVGV